MTAVTQAPLAPRAGPAAIPPGIALVLEQLPVAVFVRSEGYDVTFLGASLPAEDVGSFLREVDPIGVALSCSVAMNLPGAARVIDAAHAAGSRVLVGGRGFGSTPMRATRLGADAWADTPGEALRILASWGDTVGEPRISARMLSGEHVILAAERDALVERAMAALAARLPVMAGFTPRQLSRTRADYAFILRFLEAAALVDDETIFAEFLAWLNDVLRGAGLPATVLPLSLDVLRDCLADRLPHSASLLEEGARRLR